MPGQKNPYFLWPGPQGRSGRHTNPPSDPTFTQQTPQLGGGCVMPYSNRRSGFGRRPGTVTVIEEPVRRNAARTAKIVACVTALTVGLLTATVAASKWHPIIALFAGVLAGAAAGFIVAVAILAWPVLRAIWWWSIEIITALALVASWVELAGHTTLPFRLGAVALIAGVPAAIAPVRRWIIRVAWCVITRHRLRTCFAEFIITNRTGSLPLILWARPTPAGVRAWIWLRPGLALGTSKSAWTRSPSPAGPPASPPKPPPARTPPTSGWTSSAATLSPPLSSPPCSAWSHQHPVPTKTRCPSPPRSICRK